MPKFIPIRSLFVCAVIASQPATAQTTRARDLGVPFDGNPGPLNAITDVAGVEVGHVTLIEGSGSLVVGAGPVRTGVTAILPRGKRFASASLIRPLSCWAMGPTLNFTRTTR